MTGTTQANEAADGQSQLTAELGADDPRNGHGKEVADVLERVYNKAYNDFAGPPQFRHGCNMPTYHRAALLAVYRHLASNAIELTGRGSEAPDGPR